MKRGISLAHILCHARQHYKFAGIDAARILDIRALARNHGPATRLQAIIEIIQFDLAAAYIVGNRLFGKGQVLALSVDGDAPECAKRRCWAKSKPRSI